jgi:hypothetical protein
MFYLYHLIYNIPGYTKSENKVSMYGASIKNNKKNDFIVKIFESPEISRERKSILEQGMSYLGSLLPDTWSKKEQVEIFSFILKGYQNDTENELKWYDDLTLIYGNSTFDDEFAGQEQNVNNLELFMFYEIFNIWSKLHEKISNELRIDFRNRNRKLKQGDQITKELLTRFIKLIYYQDITKWNTFLTQPDTNIFLNVLYERYGQLFIIFVELVRKMYLFFRLIFKISDSKRNRQSFVPESLPPEAQCILGIFTLNTGLKNILPRFIRSKLSSVPKYNNYFNKILECLLPFVKTNVNHGEEGNRCFESFNDFNNYVVENITNVLNNIIPPPVRRGGAIGSLAAPIISSFVPGLLNRGKKKAMELAKNRIKSRFSSKTGKLNNRSKQSALRNNGKQVRKLKLKRYKENPIKEVFMGTTLISPVDKNKYSKKLIKEFICILQSLGVNNRDVIKNELIAKYNSLA